MSMKRFVAPTARDCLRKVKEDMGPDAIVVSNKPVPGGVEIMAMTSEGFEHLSRQAPSSSSREPAAAVAPAPRQPMPGVAAGNAAQRAYGENLTPRAAPVNRREFSDIVDRDDDYTISLSAQARKPSKPSVTRPDWLNKAASASVAPAATQPSRLRPLPGRSSEVVSASAPPVAEVQAKLRSALDESTLHTAPRSRLDPAEKLPQQDAQTQLQITQLIGEMHGIKALLERQLAGFAWGDMSRESPIRAMAMAEMLDAGFSGQLARKLCQEMPQELGIEDARKWLKGAFNRRLRTLGSDNDIIDRGGVYALVGPTGVGKTTTTAKLAARCVVRYGADKIALLTTDGYRIGAHEQLRIYGRILGVPVHVVRDGEDLRHTLADLHDKHMVLIDTVGMSQRDRMVAEQAAMLMRAGEVNRLLLLNATSRGDTLDDVVRAYAGEDLAGVILSKSAETASLAPSLDGVVRHGLLLCYIANGQRVPEDMHLPNRTYLMHRAFKAPGEMSPHHLQNDEAGLIMATPSPLRKATGGSRV